MKIGFSSLTCPEWDLNTIVAQASELGFDGVELRGVRGEFNLPLLPELAGKPEAVRQLFDERNVELACLSASASLDARNRKTRAAQKAIIDDYIELAGQLGCPFVKIFAGEVQRIDTHEAALGRIAEGLASLAPVAAQAKVTLLIENGGDFAGSADMWYLMDAVGHPAIRCCWNQCNGMTLRERPTTSIPRLGAQIAMAHVCDADFDDDGVLVGYQPPGSGMVGVDRQIELLRGMIYGGYLMFEWPKAWIPELAEPEALLPEVARFLRDCVDAKQAILTAYKGDKNPARFAARQVGRVLPAGVPQPFPG